MKSGGDHKKGDRKGKGQSTAYKMGVRSQRKFAISNSKVFTIGDVCPVQKRTKTHIPDRENLGVVHRELSTAKRHIEFETISKQMEFKTS